MGEVSVMSEDIVLLCSDGLTNGAASARFDGLFAVGILPMRRPSG